MVKLPRRQFLRLTAGAATLPALPRIASALGYPTRPVRIIVGFPPGGAADTVARLDRPMAIAAASPTIHRREPARRQLQHCGRNGCAGTRG